MVILSGPYLEILLGVFTLLLTSYLGVTVFYNNKKSWTCKFFLILSVLIDVYIVVNYISLHPFFPTPENQLFWIRIVMVATSFIGPVLILLVHTFPGEKIKLKKSYIFALITLTSFSVFASITNLVFKSIEYPNGQPVPVPGNGIGIFLLDFVGLFLLSFVILIYKYIKSKGGEKMQNLYFLLGVLITFSFMAISTVITVVVLKSSATVFLGPLSASILMIFIAYAINRYRLFAMSTLLAEFGVVVLCSVAVFSILSYSLLQIVWVRLCFAIFVVGLTVVLLYFLNREVKQREQNVMIVSLEKSNAKLRELDKQKTEFLNIAAHQLRTPVSIIRNYISMVQDGDFGQVPEQLKEVHTHIYQSNQWLVRLADEFLNLSKLESGQLKYHMESADLSKVAAEVVSEIRPKAEQKGLVLELVKPPEPVLSTFDVEKIKHSIMNLVENAVKYTPGGKIVVKVDKVDTGVSITVTDTGIGFDASDQPNLFQKFQRGKNAHEIEVNTSTGLGLYICRKFVEGHCGNVWASSGGIGQGCVFGFWLPNETKI